MNSKLEAKLVKRFPEVYDFPPRFGTRFEHDDGWNGILIELGKKISTILGGRKTFALSQVKEKFGTLRVYCRRGSNQAIDTAIREAVLKSAVTCEMCGAPGKLKVRSWIRVLCGKCARSSKSTRSS